MNSLARLSLGGLLLLARPLAAPAAEPVRPFGSPTQPTDLPLSAHRPHFLSGEFYGEYWDHFFLFEQGYAAFVQFAVSNLGWGDGRGAVVAVVVDASGRSYLIRNGRKREDWQLGEGALDMKIARHRLEGTPASFHLQAMNNTGDLDLQVTATGPPVRMGRIAFGNGAEGFYDLTMTAPRVTVRGSFKPHDGEAVRLTGSGYCNHYYTNQAGYQQALAWLTFVTLGGDDLGLTLTELITTRRYGTRRVAWLLGSRDGEVAFHDYDYRLVPRAFRRDRRRGASYLVPTAFHLQARPRSKEGDGRLSIDGKVRLRLLHRHRILDSLGKLGRLVVERFTRPVQYRFLADYDFTVEEGGRKRKLKGRGLAEILMVNEYDWERGSLSLREARQ